MKLKNKNGFTLIEIIGVIVVIALLALLITPVVTSIINGSKEKLYQNTLKNIELSAKDWFSNEENIDKLPRNFETCYINLSELKNAGMVDKDIKNPLTDELLEDELINIVVTRNGNSYNYQVKDDGSYSGSPCSTMIINSEQPTLAATNYQGYKRQFDLAISYSNLTTPDSNVFEYYLSSSKDSLVDGEWLTYVNNESQSIGSSLNGTYYVFVKRLFNYVNNKYYYSTYGGVSITIDGETYQRFGPYQFDNIKPRWTFYRKTNTNTFGDNELQKMNYAYSDDTVKITFRGEDDNFSLSTLTLNNIKILIGNTDVTSLVTKSLSTVTNLANGVEYTLSISNMNASGELSIEIANGTIEDKAGNINGKTIINTKIKINQCPYSTGTTYHFSAGTSNTFYAPCTGTYKINLAGAKGGGSNGGSGAKVSGDIYLTRKTKLLVVVGSSGGANGQAGYNGGGSGGYYGGGGATDVRVGGTSLEKRIMVAGGGGGGAAYAGGSAGGTSGLSSQSGTETLCSSCIYDAEGASGELTTCSTFTEYGESESEQKSCVARYATGGTQSSGGSYGATVHFNAYIGGWTGYNGQLGQGGSGNGGSSGGGGYYGGGGGSSTIKKTYGGGGGSSYISGVTGYGTHSSGYVFTNGNDTGTNDDNGYATITLLNA